MRDTRHSFVSRISDSGVPLEDIASLVGHSGTAVTEAVYSGCRILSADFDR